MQPPRHIPSRPGGAGVPVRQRYRQGGPRVEESSQEIDRGEYFKRSVNRRAPDFRLFCDKLLGGDGCLVEHGSDQRSPRSGHAITVSRQEYQASNN